MKRPYIFFGIVIVGIVLLAVLRLFIPQTPEKPTPGKPLLEVPPAPTIGILQPADVTFAFSKDPSLPKSLPAYAYTDYTREELEAKIVTLAPEYAIPASSTSLLRDGVFTRTWSGNGAVITLQEDSATTVTFQQTSARSIPPPPQNNPGVARDFVMKLVPPSDPITLTPAGVSTDLAEGILITDTLGVRSVEGYLYSYTLEALPVVPYPYTSRTSYVVVDNFGIVRSATIHLPPRTVIPSGHVSVLTPSDILANLAAQRGAILSVTTQDDQATMGTVAFAAFQIDSVSIVYARNQGVLLPAFILQGEGLTNKNTRQEATYFLWAAPLTQQPRLP